METGLDEDWRMAVVDGDDDDVLLTVLSLNVSTSIFLTSLPRVKGDS